VDKEQDSEQKTEKKDKHRDTFASEMLGKQKIVKHGKSIIVWVGHLKHLAESI
jgi:hypothetical protein